MKLTNVLIILTMTLASVLTIGRSEIYAALPCNLSPVVSSTEFSDQPADEVFSQPLMGTLMGVRPADRDGATIIDYDTPHAMRFRLVGAGENILRCLDYGQSEALAINATPEYRYANFGLGDEIPEGVELVSDLDDSGVYTERVENPMMLANELYLVDFIARHNDVWLTGELVFEISSEGEFYLSSSYLSEVRPHDGESHQITVYTDGLSADNLTVSNGDLIGFGNERDQNIQIVITSDETADVVFQGGNLGKAFDGPAPKSAFYVQNLEPGTYTATVSTDDGDGFVMQITVKP